MAYLKINQELLDPEKAALLKDICPFSAISYENGRLDISAACKMCKICIKKGPQGIIELVEDEEISLNKDEWRGIAVYTEHHKGEIHNVTLELIGKARELARVTGHPVYALMIGSEIKEKARKLLRYGVDKVFVYDYPELADFKIDIYTNAFSDFIEKVKPSSIMVGATNLGRTLAPRVAARQRTGLTADCTRLEMKKNSDLVQIRPAFGGNIMAQIVTPKHRPQFCTVRYKIFSAPAPLEQFSGEIVLMELPARQLQSVFSILSIEDKPREVDISEAEIIVAAGRGLKSKDDLALLEELAKLLGGVLACTRPLIENGWFDPKRQIGLSGRTVKPKLIIAAGISGAVQFVAGMRSSDCIIAINQDENASIFDVAHYGLCGDLYEIIPQLLEMIRKERG
ncbi:MAG TPA: FAD-binding protein [Desulfitobacteriaceae bacterium]|nr:FAD-binding protein [Desulfitobacteriaceae bacterium]